MMGFDRNRMNSSDRRSVDFFKFNKSNMPGQSTDGVEVETCTNPEEDLGIEDLLETKASAIDKIY